MRPGRAPAVGAGERRQAGDDPALPPALAAAVGAADQGQRAAVAQADVAALGAGLARPGAAATLPQPSAAVRHDRDAARVVELPSNDRGMPQRRQRSHRPPAPRRYGETRDHNSNNRIIPPDGAHWTKDAPRAPRGTWEADRMTVHSTDGPVWRGIDGGAAQRGRRTPAARSADAFPRLRGRPGPRVAILTAPAHFLRGRRRPRSAPSRQRVRPTATPMAHPMRVQTVAPRLPVRGRRRSRVRSGATCGSPIRTGFRGFCRGGACAVTLHGPAAPVIG